MRVTFGLSLLTFTFLLLASSASAIPSCSLSTTPCADPVLEAAALTNAHAAVPGESSYPYFLCCTDSVSTLGGACTGVQGVDYDVVVNLAAQTNAHAQQNDQTSYSEQACLSSSPSIQVDCQNVQGPDCSSLGTDYACLLSLSSATNAHIAQCGHYNTQVCCKVLGDNTPPEATVTINGGSAGTSDTDVILDLTFDDPESGIADPGCQFSNDGVTYSPLETCPTILQKAWTLDDVDGLKTVSFQVFNTLPSGPNVAIVSDTIYLDRENPTITLDPIATPTTDTAVTFTGNADDLVSPVTSIQYRVLDANDLSEHVAWTDISFAPDFSVPYTFTTVTLPDGSWRVETQAFDSANNKVDASAFFVVDVDTAAPVTTDSSQPFPQSSPLTITLTCSDSISGCAQTSYCVYDEGSTPCDPTTLGTSVELSCPPLTVCEKRVRYFSTDLVGNQESEKDSGIITLDTTKPSCDMSDLVPFSSSSSVSLGWSGNDPEGKAITAFDIFYSFDDGAYQLWQTFSGSSLTADFDSPDGEGKYKFYCKSANDIGVQGESSGVVFTTVDLTPPTASITPLPQWTNDVTFAVQWSGTDLVSGLDTFDVQYAVDSGPFSTWNAYPALVTSDVFGPDTPATVTDGTLYSFQVVATDMAGLSATSSSTATTVDLTPPTCAVSLVDVDETGLTTVSWQGSDSVSGVASASAEYSFNQIAWISITGPGGPFSIQGQDGQTFFFRCKATDNAGNEGDDSPVLEVAVDISPPVLDVSYPLEVKELESFTVEAIVTDATDIVSVDLVFAGTSVETDTVTVQKGQWELTWMIEGQPLGSYSFTITADDGQGHVVSEDFAFESVICVEGDIQLCGSNIGACQEGERTCVNNDWGLCLNSISATAEACDGLDNDCDGVVDEELSIPSCPLTLGICSGPQQTCQGSLGWSSCGTAEYGPLFEPVEVSCDNLDNDCDGQVDESCSCDPGEQRTCGSNIGECTQGIQTCQANGQWGTECENAIQPREEVCNNLRDENCDGVEDDGCLIGFGDADLDPETTTSEFPWVPVAIAVIIIIGAVAVFVVHSRQVSWNDLMKRYR